MESKDLIEQIKTWLGTGSINLFGLPYTGKDTQGRELAELLGTKLLGGGDILRGDDISPRIKEIMKSGELIPTKDYVELVLPKLSAEDLHDKPLVLSSVGRWHGEEPSVLEALRIAQHPLKVAVFLEMPEQAIKDRWAKSQEIGDRGTRFDEDSQEKIQTRLQEFSTKTIPVISFYEERDLLIRVNGDQSREKVTQDILEAIVVFSKGTPSQ